MIVWVQSFPLAAYGRTTECELQAAFQKLVQGALCVQSAQAWEPTLVVVSFWFRCTKSSRCVNAVQSAFQPGLRMSERRCSLQRALTSLA